MSLLNFQPGFRWRQSSPALNFPLGLHSEGKLLGTGLDPQGPCSLAPVPTPRSDAALEMGPGKNSRLTRLTLWGWPLLMWVKARVMLQKDKFEPQKEPGSSWPQGLPCELVHSLLSGWRSTCGRNDSRRGWEEMTLEPQIPLFCESGLSSEWSVLTAASMETFSDSPTSFPL